MFFFSIPSFLTEIWLKEKWVWCHWHHQNCRAPAPKFWTIFDSPFTCAHQVTPFSAFWITKGDKWPPNCERITEKTPKIWKNKWRNKQTNQASKQTNKPSNQLKNTIDFLACEIQNISNCSIPKNRVTKVDLSLDYRRKWIYPVNNK